jgi:Ca2+/Na+ antiporter
MGRRLARPPTGDMNVGSNPDAILLILKGIAKAFGVLGRIGGAVEGFVVSVLAALAAFGLVFGVACWFIGRGLQSEASWARISAFVLIVLAIVPAMLFALSANNIGRAVLFGVVVLCGIALYTLWNGYAPQTP